jgi:NAD(P)-dependent dehydrogenase (short-subunit alcohol dehydrogenase family)
MPAPQVAVVLQPLAHFFKTDFEQWNRAVHVNCIEQLRVVHALYPFRDKKKATNAVFFAGSGTNGVEVNMSSYIASKIMLIKMCELLEAENDDMNIFIVGPGWTRTKAHYQVIADKNTPHEKYLETLDFLNNRKGVDFQDIYDCIQWLCRQGKVVAGGRNFSVVYDQWKGPLQEKLVKELKSDSNMYKLRRYKNDALIHRP